MTQRDRHNVIYAYGHLQQWMSLLHETGMKQVESTEMAFPVPHSHHYHALFDTEERRLLSQFPWRWTLLREEDEQ